MGSKENEPDLLDVDTDTLASLKSSTIDLKIDDFSLKQGQTVDSTPLICNGAIWVVSCTLAEEKDSDPYPLAFSLRKACEDDETPDLTLYKVKWSVNLQGKTGSRVFIARCVEYFRGSGYSYNQQRLKVRKALLDATPGELLPYDTLSVLCELEISFDKISINNPYLNDSKFLIRDFEALLNNHESCDVTLQARGRKFRAHKLILGARSPVFAAMFHHDMLESRTNVVTVDDIQPQALKDLLDYIYTGKVDNLCAKRALDLYPAADKYDLRVLKEECGKIMLSDLSVDIVCEVAELADTYNEREILQAVKKFAVKNYYDVYSTKNYFHLMNVKPRLAADILQSEWLKD